MADCQLTAAETGQCQQPKLYCVSADEVFTSLAAATSLGMDRKSRLQQAVSMPFWCCACCKPGPSQSAVAICRASLMQRLLLPCCNTIMLTHPRLSWWS